MVDSVPGGLPADPTGTGEAAAVCPGAGVSQDDRDVQQMEATDRDDEVHADDSASQVGLGGSSVSGHSSGSAQSLESLRIRESAKQAALRVRMKFLKDKQMLEVREQELKMRKQELELQAALVESEALEAALTPSRSNSVVTGTAGRNCGDLRTETLAGKQLVTEQSGAQLAHPSLALSSLFRRIDSGSTTRRAGDMKKPMQPPRDQGVTSQPQVQQVPRSSVSAGTLSRGDGDARASAGAAEGDLQTNVMKKLLTSSLLPKPDVPVFSGDVTRFHQFLRAFDSRVDAIVDDDESKAYYLEQFTSGVPRDIVRGCMYLPSGGYREARCLLQKRYGDPDRVSNAFVDRMLNWQVVKPEDVAGLDRFALELRTCLNAVGGLLPENNCNQLHF